MRNQSSIMDVGGKVTAIGTGSGYQSDGDQPLYENMTTARAKKAKRPKKGKSLDLTGYENSQMAENDGKGRKGTKLTHERKENNGTKTTASPEEVFICLELRTACKWDLKTQNE